ncbi:MAG: hypothetical protein FH758_04095 [Firmicutes bacterium]|nr:hypothetical protein [Bacillota bacterium]
MKKIKLITFMFCITRASTAWAETSMPIKSVSLDKIGENIAAILMSFHETVGTFIVPLSVTMLTLMALILIVGLVFGIRTVKTIGFIGFLLCLLGLFLYAAAPIIANSVFEAGSNLNN